MSAKTSSAKISHSPIRVVVIDDETAGREMLARRIDEYPNMELVGSFDSVEEAIPRLQRLKPDLLLLDIGLPGTNGIDFLRQMRPLMPVVFVTAHRDYAVEGFELEVLDYLQKPVTQLRFEAMMRKYKASRWFLPELIMFPVDGRIVLIRPEWIIRAQGNDDALWLYLNEGKPLWINNSLADLQETLPGAMFWRVHKSHIINITHIKHVDGNRIIMIDNSEVPIGKTYQPKINRRLGRK